MEGKGWGIKGWKARGEEREGITGSGKGRDPNGWVWTVGSHPHVRNPEKYPDCRTDLIAGGDNTDICPGRQTRSRHHWLKGKGDPGCHRAGRQYSKQRTNLFTCAHDFMKKKHFSGLYTVAGSNIKQGLQIDNSWIRLFFNCWYSCHKK